MTAIQTNVSKGSEVEYYRRVLNSDPTNAVLVLAVLRTGSSDGVEGLRDFDTLAAILAGGYTEVTNTNYARIVLDQSDLDAIFVDDTNNRIDLGLGVQTWANPAAGNSWDIGLVCYDPDSTGGTDSAIIPISAHELRDSSGIVIIPNGNPVDWDLSAWITAV